MNLAIFYDAVCVSGNRELVLRLKEYIFKIASNSQQFNAHFAKKLLQVLMFH